MTELKKINATKSVKNLEYFGTYRGVEWLLTGLRSGNKVWWYLTDDEGKFPQPADNLKEAATAMKENIDYNLDNN